MKSPPFAKVLPSPALSEEHRTIIEDHFNRALLRSREFKERLTKTSAKAIKQILYGR